MTACLALMVWLPTGSAFADSFTFKTIPAAGDVSGPAGSTVGWGYSIINNSLTNWLVTTGLNAPTFPNGTPLSLFDFPILAPGAEVDVPFDAVNGLGLYQLIWDAAAPAGFTNTGSFDVTADWYSDDPFAGGSLLFSAGDQTAAFSAAVTPNNPAPVPEPSTIVLLVSGGLSLLGIRRRRPPPRGFKDHEN
jgi:hypothetical protein